MRLRQTMAFLPVTPVTWTEKGGLTCKNRVTGTMSPPCHLREGCSGGRDRRWKAYPCYSLPMTDLNTLTQCPGCRRFYGDIARHVSRCPEVVDASTDPQEQPWIVRAAAHAASWPSRSAQRFQEGVTDADVALVMYALELGARPYRNRARRWLAPVESKAALAGLHRNLSTVVHEMVRTGLVRHVTAPLGRQDALIPALVHLKDGKPGEWHSACLFTGEDLGPMRSRLVEDLTLVDCLGCMETVALGHPRGL